MTNAETILIASLKTLRAEARVNLVPFLAIRERSGLNRLAFDGALDTLRERDLVVLQSHDGRHGQLTQEQRAACVVEGGRTFAYACLRDLDD